MTDQQTVLPQGMGYVGGNSTDPVATALAAAAMVKQPYMAGDGMGYGGGGIMGLLIASLLFGRRGFGDRDDVSSNNNIILADLRKDISDARLEACKTESGIQSAIQVHDNNNQINFRALDNRICETEKAAIIFAKDGTIEDLKSEARLTEHITDFERNVDENFCKIRTDIQGVNTNIERVNTHLTHLIDRTTCEIKEQADKNTAALSLQIERGFCKLTEDNLRDEVAELRACKRNLEQNVLFSNQLTAINSAIAELNQNQRATNQTIQFGAGNLAGQAATANQVRGL